MTAQRKQLAKRPKRPSRPIHFVVRRVVDLATGEELGALVPSTGWDRKAMRDRKYHVGSELRADLKKPRNPVTHRMLHALASLVATNIEGFDEDPEAHAVVKRLQRESGLFCETVETEIPGLGVLAIKQARSLAFDDLDEGEFTELFRGLCAHISRTYWPSMSPEAIEEQVKMMEKIGP